VDPTERFDIHTGQPKKPPVRVPSQELALCLGTALAVAALACGYRTGRWPAALSLAGLVLDIAGAFILTWPVLLTWADEVREREGPFAGRLARALGSAWIEIGRAREELIHTLWGLGLLVGGFILQAIGAIVAMVR